MVLETISYSRVKIWRRCHREHFYRFITRIEKKAPPLPLLRGKILHELIEAWVQKVPWEPILANYEKEYKNLFSEEQEEYGNLPQDLKKLMEGYIRKWSNDGITYLNIEVPVEFELIPGEAKFKGVIDGIIKDARGNIWLCEHKSHKKLPDDMVRLSNLQSALYLWAAPKAGLPAPVGILWDYTRTKSPVEPEMLKSGRLSKRKNIDTDYFTYLEAIRTHGLKEADYNDILNELRLKQDTFYRRNYFPRPTQAVIDLLIVDLMDTAREILANPESKTRNLATFTCNSCQYANLCRAELFDLDPEFVIKREYVSKDKKSEQKEEVEVTEE